MKEDKAITAEANDSKGADAGSSEAGNESVPAASPKVVIYSVLAASAFCAISGAVGFYLQAVAFRRESEKTVAAIVGTWEDALKRLAKDATPAGNSAAVGAKQTAAGQRALDLGAKALAAGRIDEALLYFINGVNHDPSRMELVQHLADAALKSKSVDLAERAIGVLELTTVQVAPDDMAVVLDRINDLRAKVAPPPILKMSPEDARKRFEEIQRSYAPGSTWEDAARVASGLSEVESLQQAIEISREDNDDDRYASTIQDASELAVSLQQIQGHIPLHRHIATCVAEMKAIAEEETPDVARFSSVSASAQGVLAQTWGTFHTLPKAMQDQLRTFPGQMKIIEESLQATTSVVPFARAIDLINAAKCNESGSYTERIRRIGEALEDAAQQGEAITSAQKRMELFKEIRSARDSQAGLEIERRAAYQQWALRCLNGFMIDWNNEMSISDAEAKQFFQKHGIAQIDETLLVPEVSRVLGRVMSCMTGELNAATGSQIEYNMAATPKRKLEAF